MKKYLALGETFCRPFHLDSSRALNCIVYYDCCTVFAPMACLDTGSCEITSSSSQVIRGPQESLSLAQKYPCPS
jgi:hypothetical protein